MEALAESALHGCAQTWKSPKTKKRPKGAFSYSVNVAIPYKFGITNT